MSHHHDLCDDCCKADCICPRPYQQAEAQALDYLFKTLKLHSCRDGELEALTRLILDASEATEGFMIRGVATKAVMDERDKPTPKQALKMTEKFQFALSYLVIHGLVTDGERNKVRHRLDRWAEKHGLRKRTPDPRKEEA